MPVRTVLKKMKDDLKERERERERDPQAVWKASDSELQSTNISQDLFVVCSSSRDPLKTVVGTR